VLLVASPSSFSPSSPLPPPSLSFSLSGSSASSSRSLVGPVFSPVIGWPARSTYKEGNFARKLKLKRAAPLSLSLSPTLAEGLRVFLGAREKGEIRDSLGNTPDIFLPRIAKLRKFSRIHTRTINSTPTSERQIFERVDCERYQPPPSVTSRMKKVCLLQR